MATGFHGAHVIIGTIFLLVCLFRALARRTSRPKQHFGFEAAAWYWHFVDVVWLFLFACIYVWGAGANPGGARPLKAERFRNETCAGRSARAAPHPFASAMVRDRFRRRQERALPTEPQRQSSPSPPRRCARASSCRCPRCGGPAVQERAEAARALRRLRPRLHASSTPATARPCSRSSSWASSCWAARSTWSSPTSRRCGCMSCCGASLTPLMALVLLRFLKAALIALQFKHKAEEGRLAKD